MNWVILSCFTMVLLVPALLMLIVELDKGRTETRMNRVAIRNPEPEQGLSWWEVNRILKQMEREQKKMKSKQYWRVKWTTMN